MASTVFYTLESCLKQAQERQTVYALSVLHLFQSSIVPTSSSTKAALTSAEADYDDYVTKTLTAWFAPIYAPTSGFMIVSPEVQWTCVADQVLSNDIGGCWLEDAAGTVRMVVVFESPVPMAIANQGFPLNLADYFPTAA